MFPTANSTIYRNEAGEVLGWDAGGYDEPYEAFDDLYPDYPEPKDRAECISWGVHAEDGDGVDDDRAEDVYECSACAGRFYVDEEGNVKDLN